MPLTFRLGELTVVIVAESHNPTILNPDFLRVNEVVPSDWDPSDPAVTTPALARVAYSNGVTVQADPGRVTFTERMLGKGRSEAVIPNMARRWVEVLPHVGYVAVGINPGGIAVAETQAEALSFVLNSLVTDGPWKDALDGAARAGLTLHYGRPDGHLALTIDSTELVTSEPVVAFSANSHHQLRRPGGDHPSRAEQIQSVVDHWEEDISVFEDLSNQLLGN